MGCKNPLRAVYGSDLKAAWALLLDALHDKWDDTLADVRCALWCSWHRKPPTAYWDLQALKLESEEPIEERMTADESETRH